MSEFIDGEKKAKSKKNYHSLIEKYFPGIQ